MVWARTLGDLTTDIADRVDLTAFRNRHPPETIRRRLIESYQRLREWVTDAGSSMFLGGPYVLDQSNPVLLDYGCSFPLKSTHRVGTTNTYATQIFTHLRRIEANYLQGWYDVPRQTIFSADTWVNYQNTRYPLEFFLTGQGFNVPDGALSNWNSADPISQTTTPDQDGELRIVLMPYLGDGAYPIRIYGMPALDIVDDYNTRITLDTTGFDWLIYDAALKLVVRDNDSQGLYQMVSNERSQAEATIRKAITRELSIPTRRRDVFEVSDRYRYRRGF